MRAGAGPDDAEQDDGAAEKDDEDGSEDDGEFDGLGGDCRVEVGRSGHFLGALMAVPEGEGSQLWLGLRFRMYELVGTDTQGRRDVRLTGQL